MDSEVWKAIPGFEGYYEVSSLGRARSLDRAVRHARGGFAIKRGRLLSTKPNGHGYPSVCLSKEGKPTTRVIHQLVCEAFNGPRPEGHEAAHEDGNKANCRADNLSWKTRTENERDKKRHGTSLLGRDCVPAHSRARGERHGCARLTSVQVREARRLMNSGVSAYRISHLLNVSHTTAKSIQSEKTWRSARAES